MLRKIVNGILAAGLCCLLLGVNATAEENYCLAKHDLTFAPAPPMADMLKDVTGHPDYNGRLRIFVVEEASEWNAYDNLPYHFAFLDFAVDIPITTANGESLSDTVVWDGSGIGNMTVEENNVMVIASIFNGSGYSQSSGGGGLTFTAYNVDATAAATTTEEWPNTVNANYSHTVLIEEGTGTWCPYCPAMKNALKSIYDSHLYPMFFVALVEDMSTKANYRCTHDYNIYGYPTAFFDGGYRVKVGGDPVAANYISMIQECGARDAHQFDLGVSIKWLGSESIEIIYNLTDQDVINTKPTTPVTPIGPSQVAINKSATFKSLGGDPDDDRLSFRFYWQSGDTSTWIGLYDPLDTCSANHSWAAAGIQYVAVQSKDEWGMTSNWSPIWQVQVMPYLAGDANGNGVVNILDVTYMIAFLYKSGPMPVPIQAGDANGNGALNILDVTYLISFLYKGGPPPVYP